MPHQQKMTVKEKILWLLKSVSLIGLVKIELLYPAKISPKLGCIFPALPAFPYALIVGGCECTIFQAGGFASGYLPAERRHRIFP